MMNWVKDKLFRLSEVFEEFPRLYWLSMFYMGIVFAIVIAYQPVLEWIYNFELFNQHIFQELIQNNLQILRWSQIVLPLVVSIFCWLDIASLYEEKYFRKYKRYPC